MKSRRFFWKLFLSHATCLSILLGVCVWVVATKFEKYLLQEITDGLRAQATSLEVALRGRFDAAHAEELQGLARRLGTPNGADVRVTFVRADGRVIGDSQAEADMMESHADRPEIREALTKGWAEQLRWSHTVAKRLCYVAVRVGTAKEPHGVVRLALPFDIIQRKMRSIRGLAVTVTSLALLLGLSLFFSLARLWSRRIERVTNFAHRLSRGDVSSPVNVRGADELAVLGEALRRTGDRITRTNDAMKLQRRRLYDLLDRLDEGIVITDPNGCVFLVNARARRLLQMGSAPVHPQRGGVPVEDSVRQRELQAMLRPRTATRTPGEIVTMASDAREANRTTSDRPTEETRVEITTSSGQRSILARGFDVILPEFSASSVIESGPSQAGRLVILSDVSELKKTLQMKADFAANASHELRTPLCAMRAAIETLRCINLKTDSEAAAEFFEVLERHSERMLALVSDLLDLSRIESPATEFRRAAIQAPQLLAELHETFRPPLAQKDLQWEVAIKDGCDRCVANPDLLRMALRNLVDNAIQFTDPGGHVRITVYREQAEWCISVSDDGCGIPDRDQTRIFERFYQVQRARTGSRRGTGLGLSIVRHAVLGLGGHVSLQSQLGVGTTVTIVLPQGID